MVSVWCMGRGAKWKLATLSPDNAIECLHGCDVLNKRLCSPLRAIIGAHSSYLHILFQDCPHNVSRAVSTESLVQGVLQAFIS